MHITKRCRTSGAVIVIFPSVNLRSMDSVLKVIERMRMKGTPYMVKNKKAVGMKVAFEVKLRSKVGQLRAIPVNLGAGAPRAILAAYCACFDVDPYVEMFYFPPDTLKLALFTEKGKILWKKDLGPGVVPGMWFVPFFPFDLDGDGVDEIWFVNNVNVEHPLGVSGYRLERLDARTGKTTGQWQWPDLGGPQALSHQFRNFILGGYVRGKPVLVTAQGTYESMFLHGWWPDMKPRWEHVIDKDAPGARGSHMCPIADLDNDSVQEVMWGERCIELDGGRELFCADRDHYKGHSDVVLPVLDKATGKWFLYTCRESDNQVSPRVALFDNKGVRVWGDLDQGHIDMGWAARLGEGRRHVAMAIRIGHKTCGPRGRFHEGREEFIYDCLTGQKAQLPFGVYRTFPVDVNGDGYHEIVHEGEVFDRHAKPLGKVKGSLAMACKFLDKPGEQVLMWTEDGTVRAYIYSRAEDTDEAVARYANPLYDANRRLTSSGSNIMALAGI